MTTIVVDTNVLIALVDRGDALHARAASELPKLSKTELFTTGAVLSECAFALPRADQRARLAAFLDRLPIAPFIYGDEQQVRRSVFAWMTKYAEHVPDYADAELCVLAGANHGLRVWTYDAEFRKVWRDEKGRRFKLVGS